MAILTGDIYDMDPGQPVMIDPVARMKALEKLAEL